MKKIHIIIALAAALCAFTPFAKAQGVVDGGGQWIEKDGFGYMKSISKPTTEGIYTITLESFTTGQITVTQESIPADIVLVLDYSGSMKSTLSGGTANDSSSDQTKWSRMKVLRNAVNNFINAIYENDTVDPETHQPRPTALGNKISIITFAAKGKSSVKVALTNVTIGTSGSYQLNSAITNAVDGLTGPTGGTWADEGMTKAYNQLNFNDDTRKRRTVVLFTDGIPGDGYAWTESQTINNTKCLNDHSYATWSCANNVINTANNIKNLSNPSKDIVSSVYTVSVVTNPTEYINVYLGKTSSEWLNATKMGDYPDYTYNGKTYHKYPAWSSTDIWSNGNGVRNDNGNQYAYATTNASELNNIFDTIAASSGGSSANLDETTISQVDVVSASFSLPPGADKNSIKVYTVRYTGDDADGTHNFKTKTVSGEEVEDLVEAPTSTEEYLKKWTDDDDVEHEEMTDIDNGITWDLTSSEAGSTKKDKITVNGFDYANLWCGPDESVTTGDYPGWHQGYKIVIKIPVKMDDEAVGGPNLNTNGPGSGIYVNGVNQFPFVSPKVSLPVNIHIRKEGLEVGESAKFRIERSTDNTTWVPVTSVFVTRTSNDAKTGEDAPMTKIVGMPATDDSTPAKEYVYRVVEEPWSWSYVTGHSTPTSTDLLETNPFIFTNMKKNNIDVKVRNAESKAYNEFLPDNTEGTYVDSKPRTAASSGTTTP